MGRANIKSDYFYHQLYLTVSAETVSELTLKKTAADKHIKDCSESPESVLKCQKLTNCEEFSKSVFFLSIYSE